MSLAKEDMFSIISSHKRIRPSQLKKTMMFLSKSYIHRLLKELLIENRVLKTGSHRKIYYRKNRFYRPRAPHIPTHPYQ